MVVGQADAQTTFRDDQHLHLTLRPGLVVPGYSLYTYLIEKPVQSFEVSYTWRSHGKSYWNQIYNYPELGVAMQYATLGQRDIFGSSFSIYPFFQTYVLTVGQFAVLQKTGLGLGFVSKKYHPETNPFNVAMGSHLNLHFNFELRAQYQFLDRVALTTGISLDHLSNGNWGEPNLGVNFVTLHGGVRFLTGGTKERIVHTLPEHTPRTQWAVVGTLTLKNARSLQDRKYLASSLSVELKRNWWRVFAPGIGVDLFYDRSTRADHNSFVRNDRHGQVSFFKSGFHLSQELIYRSFSVTLQEGWYVGLQDQVFNQKMYNRLIIRHHTGKRTFVQIAMKSHQSVLDFLEFGMGYTNTPRP